MEIQQPPERPGVAILTAPELDAELEIYHGGGCVQAVGTVAGRELYFRAKYNEWSFDVANQDGNLRSDGYAGGYLRREKYRDAGWMNVDEAVKIISQCLEQYAFS